MVTAAHEESGVGTRPSFSRSLIVLGGYLLLAVVVFLPVGPFDSSHLPGGGLGDPAQMAWFLAYVPHALAHGHSLFQSSSLDYPLGVNLASNTTVPLLGALAAPVTATLGAVAAFNLLLRLSLALSAFALYAALGRFAVPRPARILGGLLYGFGPYLVGQASGDAHLDLAFGALPPLLFALGYRIATEKAPDRKAAVRRGLLTGLVMTAQYLIDPEVLADCLLLGVGALIIGAAWHRRALASRLRELATTLSVTLVSAGALLAWPLYELLAAPGHLSGPVQPVPKLQFFSEDLLEPLLPTNRQALAPGAVTSLAHFATRDLSELGGYLGLPLLTLLVALVALRRRDPLVRLCAALATAAFVLGLGGHLVVHGRITGIPLPEALLPHLPLLSNVVPSRFGGEVALFVAAAVAIALGRILPLGRNLAGLGIVALLALALVAAAPRLPLAEAVVPWPDGLPAEVTAALAPHAVVLTYPYATPPDIEAMGWQAEDHFAFDLLGGYATVRNPAGGGQYWPALLAPEAVQRYLARATVGNASRYSEPVAVPSRAALCSYLRDNHVTDVVYWRRGVDPISVGALFARVLGAPITASGDVLLYGTGSCRTG